MEKKKKFLNQNKRIEPKKLPNLIENLRNKGLTIATLNGSFDLLHAGHLYILREGAKQADIFIVALNSDSSIAKNKGPHRPLIPLKYRLEMMEALEMVDYVTWFDETDPRKILEMIKPDVHVNGEEYTQNCIEKEVIDKYNGKLVLVKRIPSLSTSEMIKKIKQCD